MTSNNAGRPNFVFSRHLSLATMLACALARTREHVTIELSDYIASCYIADPIRFLAFWTNPLDCIDALREECDVVDAAWVYQLELKEHVQTELSQREGGVSYQYSHELALLLSKVSQSRMKDADPPQIDLPELLLAITEDRRFAKMFASGFRSDLAQMVAERGKNGKS